MTEALRVFLVEPDAKLRIRLSAALSQHPAIALTGRGGDLGLLPARRDAGRPSLLVVDASRLPPAQLEALPALLSRDLRALLLSDGPLEVALPGGTWMQLPPPSADRDALPSWIDRALVPARRAPTRRSLHPPPAARVLPPQLIAIAASTGGPEALSVVLAALPEDLPVPVVLVQHLPASFSRQFAERLDRICPLRVQVAREGEVLRPGQVWLAPGDYHMVVYRRDKSLVLGLNQDPPEHGCRPAADPLFRSLAVAAPGRVLAAVLTGMGYDGGAGARAMADTGSVVLAQDEETSVVWGMPGAVVSHGAAAEVLPLEAIAPALCGRLAMTRRAA